MSPISLPSLASNLATLSISSLMSHGSAATAPPRPVSPARKTLRRSSPLNPRSRPERRSATAMGGAAATPTQIQIANLERLLYRPLPAQPEAPGSALEDPEPNGGGGGEPAGGGGGGEPAGGGNGLLNSLNLSALMLTSRFGKEEVSPRGLRQLQRLLSDSNKPSPRNTIAPRWREYHGGGGWEGLLDPLDENLRRELIRYGDLVHSAYQAFSSNPSFRPEHRRAVALPDRNYRVTRSLYATASLELPRWVSGFAPWMAQRSSWVGYVAVCESEREIKRMGRRDIVIALRGTSTCLEWAENLRAGLAPLADDPAAKVEKGFLSLYKTAGAQVPSLSAAVLDEVRRLMELYKGEELSITVTGHSLGAALSVLVGEELSRCVPGAPPVAVFSFGGPKVGNRGFADAVERQGVKVLRVVNANDVVTRVPMAPPLADGYVDVGAELRVDSRESPYLRRNADPGCCHDLEAYLHLVDGFLGKSCPFRADAKRSLARLLCQQGTNVKKLYMSKVRDLDVDPAAVMARSNFSACLPSPSSS